MHKTCQFLSMDIQKSQHVSIIVALPVIVRFGVHQPLRKVWSTAMPWMTICLRDTPPWPCFVICPSLLDPNYIGVFRIPSIVITLIEIFMETCGEQDDSFRYQFQTAIDNKDVQKAADLWIRKTEKVLASGARNAEGQPIQFGNKHFGRTKGVTLKHKPCATPINRVARPGEVNSVNGQAPTWLRQHLRQSRRLMSLSHLLLARDRNPTDINHRTCNELWNAITRAQGFQGGFPHWAVQNLQWVVPILLTPRVQKCVGSLLNNFGSISPKLINSSKKKSRIKKLKKLKLIGQKGVASPSQALGKHHLDHCVTLQRHSSTALNGSLGRKTVKPHYCAMTLRVCWLTTPSLFRARPLTWSP